MDQAKFTGIFSSRPQNFALFLGAGASRSAGLPTASDIIWDLKRRYYCQEENQEITRQDIQNKAVQATIQSFMDSRGFPKLWDDDEYPCYFEKIFGENKERQRKYLSAMLAEQRASLSVGNRVLGAMISSGLARTVFTTNFDSIVEKSVAEVSGSSLAAFHLEGSHNAVSALDNEEFPIYCKLHGDFRHDSLKNLAADLADQNQALSRCMVNAANRFGFIVTGYSGRDLSVMKLFHEALETSNPFPHGLYWTGMKGASVPPAVEALIEAARKKGVEAHVVPIETFDTFMLRLWRNIEQKPPKLDAAVRKSQGATVDIPLPPAGHARPILRLNALPIGSLPKHCQELSFSEPVQWGDLHKARRESEGRLILTKSDKVLCWGNASIARAVFGKSLSSVATTSLPPDICAPDRLYLKGFAEEALCTALVRERPLLTRTNRSSSWLIVDRHAQDQGSLNPIFEVIGKESGTITGLFAPTIDDAADPQEVSWAEALRVSIDMRAGRLWVLLDPDIWIWPSSARRLAGDFISNRKRDRHNNIYNDLLNAWIRVIFGDLEPRSAVSISAFSEGSDAENPSFILGNRTAFARRGR